MIHSMDPNHPVTYRSAEDAFAPWIIDELHSRPDLDVSGWFIWGTNVYLNRNLSDIVDNWPSRGMNAALWVSEFAPGGTSKADRPGGFRNMWTTVERHPWVLGGAVYAWTRQGPEEIDRTLGVTSEGLPVNQDLFVTLRSLFHEPDPFPTT